MYWHCKLCDSIKIEELKIRHLESKFHISLVNSIIRKYIKPNPLSNEITDIIKYFFIHYRKYNKFKMILLLNLLTPSNQIEYIRIQHSSSH